MAQPKRLIIKEAIEAGGATKESLMETAECTAASLATNFTYLRLMGFYPVKADDDTFSFVTEEEWDEIQAERKEKAGTRKTTTPKTPEEVHAAAVKRLARCGKAKETAAAKLEQFPDEEVVVLRATIATAEHRLAEINLEAAEENLEADKVEVGEADEDGVEIDQENLDAEETTDDDLV